MKKYLFANWKMYLEPAEAIQLARVWCLAAKTAGKSSVVGVFPSFVDLAEVKKELKNSAVCLGAQNCAFENKGALTGEVSPGSLRILGCRYVLVGHSERRHIFGETDATVAKKFIAAQDAGLIPVLCVGEQKMLRTVAAAVSKVRQQLMFLEKIKKVVAGKNFIIAYEPVWAIGTGNLAPAEHIIAMHQAIRNILKSQFGTRGMSTPILYGGSISGDTSEKIVALSGVDGLLVGGASTKIDEVPKLIKPFV